MSVSTYDPKSVSLIIGGLPITGFAEDSFIEIERDEELYTTEAGADGEITRSKVVSDTATCRVTLQQSSRDNAILSALHTADRLSNAGITPFLFQEGLNVVAGAQCWVQKLPTLEYGKTAGGRQWEIRIAKAEFTINGNNLD